ncbi:MAG: hypothetical protein RJB09_1675, partial [Pseudomonadota bacterium]
PNVRRVAVSLGLLGFTFEHDARSVFGDFDSMRTINLHIPTKPAGYPEVKSAIHSNLIAATVPISSRPGDAVSSGRFW